MVLSPTVSRSNWNLGMLVFVEGGKPEYPEKNPRSGDENQQNGITVCGILLCFSKGSLQDYPSFVSGHMGPIALLVISVADLTFSLRAKDTWEGDRG